MLSFLTAAPLFRRESDPPTALMTALFLILLDNPFAAKSVSLQLSFGAVVGLLWLSPKLYRGLAGKKKHGRLFTFTTVSISTTFGCLALTAPISAYYFGSFAPVSLLSNLLCLWAVGIVFIGGLAAVLLSFFYLPLGTVIGLVPRLLIKYILAVCHALGGAAVSWRVFLQSLSEILDGVRVSPVCCAWLLKPKGRRKFAVAAALSVLTLAVTVRAGGEPVLSPAERRGGGRGTGTKRHFEIRDGDRLSGLRQRKQLAGRRMRHGGRAADYGCRRWTG